MLLQQHRHVATATAALPSSNAPQQRPLAPQRAPTRLYAAAAAGSKKPAKGTSSASSSSGGGSSSPRPASGAAAAPASKELVVLKAVPGIGKVYMQKLQEKGISSVDKLADSILDKLAQTSAGFTPAVKYLQEELGIRRQDHAQRIVKHITAKFDGDLHSRLQEFEGLLLPGGQGSPPLTLCVEGNISAGKSTFLQYITNNNRELQQQLGVVHEPVEEWQRVPSAGGSTLNLLDHFYQDPEKYAYTFQNYVFMSRVLQERNSVNIQQPVRLMERSVFSDRMVFVRAVKESGWMGDVELAVYDSWFGPILDANPTLVPDGFIYLKCAPNTCMERLKMRNRSEETTIKMDYLEGLHEKHEDWLGAGPKCAELRSQARRRVSSGVRLPNGLWLPGDIPSSLRDSLYVLDNKSAAPEMHAVLHGVPALVLDVDQDVLRDMDLQRKVQQTVADYIALMRQYREQRAKELKKRDKADSASANAGVLSSSSSSSRSGGRRRRSSLRTQHQEAPESVQQAIELVTGTAEQEDFQVVTSSSGQLQEGVAVLDSARDGLQAVSGGLEALHAAAARSRDGGAGKLSASATA